MSVISRTLIIAEVGENHGGDWRVARAMLAAAAEAGADMVKFQSYRGADVADGDPEKDWFAKVELPDSIHRELAAMAGRKGIGFLSSPFTVERARFLREDLGLEKIKIASSEMLNFPLLDYVNGKVNTVFLSTGMARLNEIREAVAHLQDVPTLYLFHCVTQYPTRPADANLRAIGTLKAAFPECRVGYSDHTLGGLACLAAVALGAEAVEKHFTLDRDLPGTDHVLSFTPPELREFVGRVRELEILLGSPVKEPVAGEKAIREWVRHRFPKGVADPAQAEGKSGERPTPAPVG